MRLIAFDLDRTLIVGNCSFSFCRYLISKKVLPFYALLFAIYYHVRHTFFGLPLEAVHHGVFNRFLKGLSLKDLQEHASCFLDKFLPAQWYLPTWQRLQEAKKRGDPILLLSNSPSFLVEKVAQVLEIEHWYASEYAVDSEGVLCAITTIMGGEEKGWAVQQEAKRLGVSLENVEAYSDSFEDLPLLFLVGKAVGVNPDRRLLSVCQKRGWEVL